MNLPILTITGSYDDDQPGALEHYNQHMRHASPEVRSQHYLIIGPWDHAGTRTPKLAFGGARFGTASLLDLPRLHAEWYAWTMQGREKPAFLEKPVAYYITGAERWRYAGSLQEITSHVLTYFLESNGSASDVLCAGSLSAEVGKGTPDHYTFDPCESNGLELEAEAHASGHSLVDQTVVSALYDKLLVYHTAPFTQDTEIRGFFKLSVWMAINCPDTDFYFSVYELVPDGGCLRLSTDAMRARYRKGLRSSELIDTTEPLHYSFERFTFVSRQVKRGSRLRLIIGPLGRLIEGTFIQKNYNGGGVVAEETAWEGRPVTVRLFHDEAHPSALCVPIGRPVLPDEPQAPPWYFEQTTGAS